MVAAIAVGRQRGIGDGWILCARSLLATETPLVELNGARGTLERGELFTYRSRSNAAVELRLGRRARRRRLDPLESLLGRRPAAHFAGGVEQFCKTERAKQWADAV